MFLSTLQNNHFPKTWTRVPNWQKQRPSVTTTFLGAELSNSLNSWAVNNHVNITWWFPCKTRIVKLLDSSRVIIQECLVQFTWLSILVEILCLWALWPSLHKDLTKAVRLLEWKHLAACQTAIPPAVGVHIVSSVFYKKTLILGNLQLLDLFCIQLSGSYRFRIEYYSLLYTTKVTT